MRANIFIAMEDFEAALLDLDKVLALDECSTEALERKAAVFCGKGDYQQALLECQKAMDINEEMPVLYPVLGYALVMAGRAEEGFSYLNQGVEQLPNMPRAFIRRGMALRESGDYQASLTDINQALEMCKPSYFRYYDERALIYLAMGDTAAAAADFQKALELYPNDRIALENLRALGVPGY